MKKASPRLIGLFVIGSVLLMVAAVLLFGSQHLFAKKRRFVAYFTQSIQGLALGAPVMFRGVTIGEVVNIDAVFDPSTGSVVPRATLEVRPETIVNVELPQDAKKYPLFPILVKHGMRASLRSQ
ncbi:MAG: MlaD family protein, partial [Acidiferrobacterales bacterium]